MEFRVRVGHVVFVSLILFLSSVPAVGQEFAAILRDENALGLTPTTRSRGMGGTYVGVDEYWSMNPASIANTEKLTGELGYSYWDHDTGPETDAGRLDLWAPVKLFGLDVTLRLMGYYYVADDPEDGVVPPFMNLEYESSTIGLQAGLNLNDWWAVGVGAYPYEKAHVEFDLPLPGDGAVGVEGTALSQVGSIQLGTLFRLPYHVNVGAQYIYIIDELKAFYDDRQAIEDALEVQLNHEDDFHINYLALGASWEPVEWLLLGVDYWNGEAEGAGFIQGTEFDQDVDRWNFGAEVRPCEYVSVRAGGDNGGATAGLTVSPMENLDLNYAYVDKAFRDKENAWGETELHTVSVTVRF